MTAIAFILAFGCAFGAALFNLNVIWGDRGAKTVRNTLGAIAVASYILFLALCNLSTGSAVMLCGVPMLAMGMFLAEPSIMHEKEPGVLPWVLIIAGSVTAIIGAIMI